MRKMKQVNRYRCEWCGKEFHTPNLHVCKWDPDCKNCLSCVHRGEFVDGEPDRIIGSDETNDLRHEEGSPAYFECHAGEASVDYGVGWNEFPVAATAIPRYDSEGKIIHCPDHKTIRGYKGKQTFKEIEEKHRLEANKKPTSVTTNPFI